MTNSMKTILRDLEEGPLSKCLRRAMHVAHDSGAKSLERWLRLELGGYLDSNSAMGEDIVVPKYRTVVGQHLDLYGRVFLPTSDFSFVNETRLRNGIEELEALASCGDAVTIHDPQMCELIRVHLKVDVYFFRFSAIHVKGVMSAIRTELEARIHELKPVAFLEARSVGQTEEILQLRPNLYGIGFDLRALWRRWTGTKKE